MIDVVAIVCKALEVLSAAGTTAAMDYGREVKGWSDYTGNDYMAAMAVNDAMVAIPAAPNLALMVKVLRNDPVNGWAAMRDLACFAAHDFTRRGLDGEKFGRAGLEYWVVHWARGGGSSRDAAFRFGKSFDTHQRYYREMVQPLLDSWLTVACGHLEPVIEEHYEKYRAAA